MKEDAGFMELDLGRVEPRSTFLFERTFDLPTPEGGTAACAVTVDASVTRSANRYLVEARVKGTVRAECHRCLAPFEMPVDTTFTMILNRGELAIPPDDVEAEDDVVSIPVSGDATFDIFPRVREAVILEIPIKLLCREDCRGVCVKCGANLNEGECGCGAGTGDPRWGALKKFLNGEHKT
jgi:uncharacterized protein